MVFRWAELCSMHASSVSMPRPAPPAPVTSSALGWLLVEAPVEAPERCPSLTHSLNVLRMAVCDSLKMPAHLRPLQAWGRVCVCVSARVLVRVCVR